MKSPSILDISDHLSSLGSGVEQHFSGTVSPFSSFNESEMDIENYNWAETLCGISLRSQGLRVVSEVIPAVCELTCCPGVRHGILAGSTEVYQHENWDLPPIGLLCRNQTALMCYKPENGILHFSPGSRKP